MSVQGSNSEIIPALLEEFLARYRRGERPSLDEYIDRHPELADEIRAVFPAAVALENVAPDEPARGQTRTAPGSPSRCA